MQARSKVRLNSKLLEAGANYHFMRQSMNQQAERSDGDQPVIEMSLVQAQLRELHGRRSPGGLFHIYAHLMYTG
jgi:hypothetical protein